MYLVGVLFVDEPTKANTNNNTRPLFKFNFNSDAFFSIQPTNCVKFLGVFIDDHQRFSKHIDEVIRK